MQSSRRTLRVLALSISLVLLTMLLAGCGQKEEAPETETLSILVLSQYVDDERLTAFADDLRKALPKYDTEAYTLDISGVSSGSADIDPMMEMAAMAQITGRLATGEIDLILCDPANGARYSRSETFIPLAEVEGLDVPADREIAYRAVDDMGEETDEMLAPTGVDLSGHETLRGLVGNEVGAHIVMNTKQLPAAVAVIEHLLAEIDS